VADCILGQGLPLHQADYQSYFPGLDVSLLTQQWSTAKELAMLPGQGCMPPSGHPTRAKPPPPPR
jgi:hypothetical protein